MNMNTSSSRMQHPEEPTLLPQYGFGATYTFDALVEHHPFLYRVYTPKHHAHSSRASSPRPASPFRPPLSRSPSSLSISFSSIRSLGSGDGDTDDAPGDPYFLSRRFRDDLTSPDPGTRRRTLSTLSNLSGGSGSYTYVGSEYEYDFSDGESDVGTAVSGKAPGLTRSSSMMLSPARRRVDSLTAARPGSKRSASVGQLSLHQKLPPSPAQSQIIGKAAEERDAETNAEPDQPAGAQMTYADLVRHLDWTTRARSPYVTTSFSFFWALWEAVRRYRLGIKHDVEIAVIDARRLRGSARTALEVLRGVEGDQQDKAYWKWYRFALETQDVLVFGAIPGDAIYASTPLTNIMPMLPDYFFRLDSDKNIQRPLADPSELEPRDDATDVVKDPRSPTATHISPPVLFPVTPSRTNTGPISRAGTPSSMAAHVQERALAAQLLSTLAWDVGTVLKPPRRSKSTASTSTAVAASPGKEKRHTSHRDFCHALTQSFLSPVRPHDARVHDATTGAVRLAALLIGPWVRARCAEGAALDAFGEEDDDDDDDDELSRSIFGDEREGDCLGVSGDGCSLGHSRSHSGFKSTEIESRSEEAQREAGVVLSELATALARWPAAWWAAEHESELTGAHADAVRSSVSEAAQSVSMGVEREQRRIEPPGGMYESRFGSESESDERRGREETRVREKARTSSITHSPKAWPVRASSARSSSPSPAYKPRARSPLGLAPSLLGPAIVLQSGKSKSRMATSASSSGLNSFEEMLEQAKESPHRGGTSPAGVLPQAALRQAAEFDGDAGLRTETLQDTAWSPSTPPPTPPMQDAAAFQRDSSGCLDYSRTGSRSPPPPPPRSHKRPGPASTSESTSLSESYSTSDSVMSSVTSLAGSVPGGWPGVCGDEDSNQGQGRGVDKDEGGDDVFIESRTLATRQQPFAWAGSKMESGMVLGGELPISSSPLGGSRTSSMESLRGSGSASASLYVTPSPSPSPLRSQSLSRGRDGDARASLLAEVVQSMLGAEVSPADMRLNTSTPPALPVDGQAPIHSTVRPLALTHHRRHSSQLEQELSPVREEMEGEAEPLGEGNVGGNAGLAHENRALDGLLGRAVVEKASATEADDRDSLESLDGHGSVVRDNPIGNGDKSVPSADITDGLLSVPLSGGYGDGNVLSVDPASGSAPVPVTPRHTRERSVTLESIPEEDWSFIDMPIGSRSSLDDGMGPSQLVARSVSGSLDEHEGDSDTKLTAGSADVRSAFPPLLAPAVRVSADNAVEVGSDKTMVVLGTPPATSTSPATEQPAYAPSKSKDIDEKVKSNAPEAVMYRESSVDAQAEPVLPPKSSTSYKCFRLPPPESEFLPHEYTDCIPGLRGRRSELFELSYIELGTVVLCVRHHGLVASFPPFLHRYMGMLYVKLTVEQVFTLAKQGSLPHTILITIRMIQLPPNLKVDVLNYICGTLPKLSDALALAHDEAEIVRQQSIALIIGIGGMCDQLRKPGTMPLITCLRQSWEKLLAWVRYLYEDHLLLPENTDSGYDTDDGDITVHIGMSDAVRHVCLFLWSTVGFDRFFSRIPEHTKPSAFALVARLWLLESWERVPGLNFVAARLLHDCTHDADRQHGLMSDCLVSAAGGDVSRVLDALFRRLRLEEPIPVPTFNAIVNMMSFVDHPLIQLFLQHPRWVSRVSRAAARLIRYSKEPGDVRVIVVNYLGVFMRQRLSIPQILQALKTGLLQAIVDGGQIIPKLSEGLNVNILETVKEDLSLGLVFHSVLSVSLKAMRKIRPDEIQEKITRGLLKKEWDAFSEILVERAVLKKLYRIGLLRGNRLKCEECSKKFRRYDMKRCEGCMLYLYCSKECQKRSWKSGHRHQCSKKAKEVRELQDGVQNSDEHAFLHLLAITDVRRHLVQLEKNAERQFPDTPFSDLGVTIDYQSNPPTLSLFPAIELAEAFDRVNNGTGRVEDIDPSFCMEIAEQAAHGVNHARWRRAKSDIPQMPAILCVDVVRGPMYVRTAFPFGVSLCAPKLKNQGGAGAKGPCRRSAVDGEGRQMDACFDEVDEVLRRLRAAAARCEGGGEPKMHLWERLEEVTRDMETSEDWPFVVEKDE
ncbi:hypothetical protein EW145_g3183 [Phellinidium pouzarii]|uniref:MYND-type domain-containing protein n=1 Tax=Phellinidium pouzarii TaxID=167371 RepID=A0A4S4L807_9AGAM|nr:hypothetical protein EW145_g3183 [Phellinidium pouzarii]